MAECIVATFLILLTKVDHTSILIYFLIPTLQDSFFKKVGQIQRKKKEGLFFETEQELCSHIDKSLPQFIGKKLLFS